MSEELTKEMIDEVSPKEETPTPTEEAPEIAVELILSNGSNLSIDKKAFDWNAVFMQIDTLKNMEQSTALKLADLVGLRDPSLAKAIATVIYPEICDIMETCGLHVRRETDVKPMDAVCACIDCRLILNAIISYAEKTAAANAGGIQPISDEDIASFIDGMDREGIKIPEDHDGEED